MKPSPTNIKKKLKSMFSAPEHPSKLSANMEDYLEAFARYSALYPALKPVFDR